MAQRSPRKRKRHQLPLFQVVEILRYANQKVKRPKAVYKSKSKET
jgi:hypothetical protein